MLADRSEFVLAVWQDQTQDLQFRNIARLSLLSRALTTCNLYLGSRWSVCNQGEGIKTGLHDCSCKPELFNFSI